MYIPSDGTSAPPDNDFLKIYTAERFNDINKSHYFRQASGTQFNGCPEILEGKEFIGYREVFWFTPINVMVRLTEFHPVPGRVWVKFYNSGTWGLWRSTTPVLSSSTSENN